MNDSVKKPKEIKITVVDFVTYTDIDFQPPANFFVMDSMQNYHFIHTSNRLSAQQWCDEYFGKNRYTVKASKITKTKSKLESGGLSAVGSQSRRGQRK